MKRCINCKDIKPTVTKRSDLCKECFEQLLNKKLNE